MSETRSYGIKIWKMADTPADGTMALDASLEQLAVTVRGSASLVTDDPQVNDAFSEENDEPEESIYVKGNTNLKLSIYDLTPETAAAVLGGTVDTSSTPNVWNAPSALPDMEKSIQLVTKKNLQINLPRVKFFGKINFQFSRTGLLQLDISARVLSPGDAATAPISWSQLSA